MDQYKSFFDLFFKNRLEKFKSEMYSDIAKALSPEIHAKFSVWNKQLSEIKSFDAEPAVSDGAIFFRPPVPLNRTADRTLKEQLKLFAPWRKGPFKISKTLIDSEWRSDIKWKRIEKSNPDFKNKRILDIGSGNGYFCWRSLIEGAEMVIGLEPFLLNVFQFLVQKKFSQKSDVWVLPIGIECFPKDINFFDTVFSMGLLYHRKSPLEHLLETRSLLKQGGELFLETLTADGSEGYALTPKERYAKMNNVWFLPSVPTLTSWLEKCRFTDIKIIDVSVTTGEEQRRTSWMNYESLDDFLHPENKELTIEGLPAPKRVLVKCIRP